MKSIQHILRSLLLPIIFILLSFVLTVIQKDFPLTFIQMTPWITYLVLALGLLLAVWFNRSRSFFVLLIVILSLFFLVDFKPSLISNDQYIRFLYPFVSILIPINILLFAFIMERGIFSKWGVVRFGTILFQLVFVASNIFYSNEELISGIEVVIVPFDTAKITPLPDLSILFFIVTMFVVLWKKKEWATHLDKALIGAPILLLLALHSFDDVLSIRIHVTFIAVLFIIAQIQDAYRMAYIDELTTIPGRRALKEELLKLSTTYTIAMLDVDHFKKFNDKHGHDVGDEVLKLVASCIKDVSGGGKAFRYGGEEFTIVFPNKKLDESTPFLEELRERIAKTGLEKNRSKQNQSRAGKRKSMLYVTTSIGVAESSEKYKTPDDVIIAADKALYRAKEKGRNQVSK